MAALLTGLRALDLTDATGYFCGQVLARLGADVIKVERPGGDPGRAIGPFAEGGPDGENSLPWLAGNVCKRSITLDIGRDAGRALFLRLTAGADFVIESAPHGRLAAAGLGYDELRGVNRGLILTSITPFATDGPYRDYAASDLIVNAIAGVMSLIGPMSGPPSRMAGELSYYMGGGHAALGTLLAYYHRELTGEGQQVHASLLAALIQVFYRATAMWDNDRLLFLREDYYKGPDGEIRKEDRFPNLWDCKDGRVFFTIDFSLPKTLVAPRALVEWMRRSGADPGELGEIDWDTFDPASLTPERRRGWTAAIARFFAGRTMQELFEEGMALKLGPAPILPLPAVLEHEQLAARGYWQPVEHPELGRSALYPGHLFLSSETENVAPQRAPRIGEHNDEVYGQELGLPAEELQALRSMRVI
jgi:crotonobetainyl-CoA:carnitine CoA-transferase CaiB-like acyl-CoA transferase